MNNKQGKETIEMAKIKPTYLISIDGSTKKTGIAVYKILKNGKSKLHKYALIDAESKTEIPNELKKKNKDKKAEKLRKSNMQTYLRICYTIDYLREYLKQIIEEGCIFEIAMEDVYAQNNINTLKHLARLQGSVLALALENDISIQFISPQSWRSTLGISQNDGNKKVKRDKYKEISIKMVQDKFNILVTDDVADAILIGMCACTRQGFEI